MAFICYLFEAILFIYLIAYKDSQVPENKWNIRSSSYTQEPLACCGRVVELSKKLRSSWPSKSKNYLQNIPKQSIRHPITLSFDSWGNLTVFSLHLANHVLTSLKATFVLLLSFLPIFYTGNITMGSGYEFSVREDTQTVQFSKAKVT